MADIILAEHQGQFWLVSGEGYIDDLLANALANDVTIEFVACESQSDVTDLWRAGGDPDTSSDQPWLIHPAIAARIRGALGDLSVVFTPWSAMLDDAARAVLVSAVARAGATMHVVLTRRPDADEAAAAGDLAKLRLHLIEAHLATLGLPADRVLRAVGTGDTNGADSIDIVVRAI